MLGFFNLIASGIQFELQHDGEVTRFILRPTYEMGYVKGT
jgi:hypothetical protein